MCSSLTTSNMPGLKVTIVQPPAKHTGTKKSMDQSVMLRLRHHKWKQI